MDVRNYNSMLLLTRREMDDTIHKYKPCLVQNNWKMQRFLDTNLGVRRTDAIAKHNKQFATRDEATENVLVFTPWWKDDTKPDVYLGGTPKVAEVNLNTLRSHSEFLKGRRSKSLPRGGAMEPLARMAMEGMRRDDRQTDKQARRRRTPSQRRHTEENQTQAIEDMRMHRDHFTNDWTAQMEADFLNPRQTRHAAQNKSNWMALSNGMKHLIRMTYRTAQGHPITNTEEQANHFGSHLRHWMGVWRDHYITSDEYWRVMNLTGEGRLGYVHTRPCRYYVDGTFCKNEDGCQHLHIREKAEGRNTRYRRGA